VVSELDGVERIHAYQKIAEHPAYVSYGLSLTSIAREWRANLIAYGVVAALSALALSSLSAFALVRASQERRLFMRWRIEAERREAAEEALRQAQKMEAVGQLTGGIAHDFNNLLTVVIGNLEIAGRALGRHNLEKAQRNIAAAVQGADRAATLTHRLLAFSRRQPLQPSAVDINEVVTEMTDLFRRTLGESVRIETVLAKDLWPAHADRNQLESAFLNLVINSRDAMPDGGLVTIKTGNVWLEAGRASEDADVSPEPQVMVSVSDTGIGMPPEVRARVFEPFFTTKQVGQGTGLGLSMIYGFVKQSGGHIRIDSEPGRGTEVRIYLPRAELNVPATIVSSGAAPRARRGEAVLVVEDDADVRAFAVEALSSLGYRILQARDAASALAVLRFEEKIALLFTDVGLPGPNGRELAEKAIQLRPDLRVLFTTGYAPEAMILDPGTHLLKKPFTVEELANSVRRAIEAGPAVLESA
jgi:signal transduction histidine kinase